MDDSFNFSPVDTCRATGYDESAAFARGVLALVALLVAFVAIVHYSR